MLLPPLPDEDSVVHPERITTGKTKNNIDERMAKLRRA
jgi:hypothetical protein